MLKMFDCRKVNLKVCPSDNCNFSMPIRNWTPTVRVVMFQDRNVPRSNLGSNQTLILWPGELPKSLCSVDPSD